MAPQLPCDMPQDTPRCRVVRCGSSGETVEYSGSRARQDWRLNLNSILCLFKSKIWSIKLGMPLTVHRFSINVSSSSNSITPQWRHNPKTRCNSQRGVVVGIPTNKSLGALWRCFIDFICKDAIHSLHIFDWNIQLNVQTFCLHNHNVNLILKVASMPLIFWTWPWVDYRSSTVNKYSFVP